MLGVKARVLAQPVLRLNECRFVVVFLWYSHFLYLVDLGPRAYYEEVLLPWNCFLPAARVKVQAAGRWGRALPEVGDPGG